MFRSHIFPLYKLSFFWSSFIGALLTILLGTALGVLTGGVKACGNNVSLTSPLFLNLWRRFKFFANIIQVDKESKNGGSTLLRNDEDVREKTSRVTKPRNSEEEKCIFASGLLTNAGTNELSL
uniref:Uncharacterized protein n=1 Tax=Rhipicephalus microplus TaxID=6941 RepID=A0A6M2D123_RHIMP